MFFFLVLKKYVYYIFVMINKVRFDTGNIYELIVVSYIQNNKSNHKGDLYRFVQ